MARRLTRKQDETARFLPEEAQQVPEISKHLPIRKGSKTRVTNSLRERSFTRQSEALAKQFRLVHEHSRNPNLDTKGRDSIFDWLSHITHDTPKNVVKAAFQIAYPEKTANIESYPKNGSEALGGFHKILSEGLERSLAKQIMKTHTPNANLSSEELAKQTTTQPKPEVQAPHDAGDLDRTDDAYDLVLAKKIAKAVQMEKGNKSRTWLSDVLSHARHELTGKGVGVERPNPKILDQLRTQGEDPYSEKSIAAAGGTPLNALYRKLKTGELIDNPHLHEALDETKHPLINKDYNLVNPYHLHRILQHVGPPDTGLNDTSNKTESEKGFMTPEVIQNIMKVTPGKDAKAALQRAATESGRMLLAGEKPASIMKDTHPELGESSPHAIGRKYRVAGKDYELQGFKGQNAVFKGPEGMAKAPIHLLDKFRSPVKGEKEDPLFDNDKPLSPMSVYFDNDKPVERKEPKKLEHIQPKQKFKRPLFRSRMRRRACCK